MIRNFLGYFLIILLELPQICKHYNKRDKNKRVTFHEELNNKHIYLKIQYFLLFCILYCEFFSTVKRRFSTFMFNNFENRVVPRYVLLFAQP